MAEINELGNVTARCPGCAGALSSFEWRSASSEYGQVLIVGATVDGSTRDVSYRAFRCAGCGRGGLGVVAYQSRVQYPGGFRTLLSFYPEVKERLALPPAVPEGIAAEFREGEACLDANCIRAAAGMFRSVLDKTLRANGYKVKPGTNLEQQIDAAGADGVITESRRLRAHDEIRVLGNDVLHDEWHPIPDADVMAARHYAQRILEDFYDDRPSVLALLKVKGRTPDELKAAPAPPSP